MVFDEVVLDALCHAAYYADDELASLLAQGVERIEAVEYLLLGIITYRAGVEQYGVGIVEALAGLVACHLHD